MFIARAPLVAPSAPSGAGNVKVRWNPPALEAGFSTVWPIWGKEMSYARFLAMIATSTVTMVWLNAYWLEHVLSRETRIYMALCMGATTAFIALLFMWGMNRQTAVNAVVIAGSGPRNFTASPALADDGGGRLVPADDDLAPLDRHHRP
jgi:hypothetical protein